MRLLVDIGVDWGYDVPEVRASLRTRVEKLLQLGLADDLAPVGQIEVVEVD